MSRAAATAQEKVRLQAYLAGQPAAQRRALRALRAAIRAAVPGASDGFSYGIPACRVDGRVLVWYAGWKEHASLYPITPPVRRAMGTALKGYVVSKGTVRFPLDRPIPATLVKRLVRARLALVRKG